MNWALLGKWIWRLGSKDGNLWNIVSKSKYGKSAGGWWTKDSSSYKASAIWRGILKTKNKVLKGVAFDLGPVTIADRAAEESMSSIILENFPSHAIYGEENGWRCKEKSAEYVWVLDPIDGTKSFITGKPLFGTLIALLYKGKPIVGIIDQPILRERWIGMSGRRTTLNGQEVSTRTCSKLSQAYLYTTSPHLFSGDAEEAFARVRSKVKVPLYGCDCYAYALLASGYVDLVIESGLKPYDILSLIPVIEGAGGVITDWKGHELFWEASPGSRAASFNVVAAGDAEIHQQALDLLQWK
ncbi:bifunctional phosphatase IMPL2, chloroplastic isoform X3 [Magnolia sinica]|uniref:bifunctional phosphatase IMPL2, chloroplastic isoform X3 n=1 Tax=Magnolia sinica TaxID=86752 RepID=UPI002659CB33|nr:bifunctional phosphatase IMPL2, chloroplastic isoform X3 [Magnolia sinica]